VAVPLWPSFGHLVGFFLFAFQWLELFSTVFSSEKAEQAEKVILWKSVTLVNC
jgi:hypothetical protein